MIDLPDFSKSFDYENNFYLSCDSSRMGKIIAHYELFKMVQNTPGAIIDCGVFKGVSLVRFAMFRDIFSSTLSKKIIGFDVFGSFPKSGFNQDDKSRSKFIKEAGSESIDINQLKNVLKNKKVDRYVELVKGDICKTVPQYVKDNAGLKISLLNLDVDLYEPSAVILEYFWPRIVKGGVLIVDDYGIFAGENKAVDDYFKDKKVKIRKFSFSKTPSYIIKE
jgi:hypothetical protein